MSFDIFLQDFSDEPTDQTAAVRQILTPLLDASGLSIKIANGEADVYGLSETPLTSLMFNNVEGDAAWDVLYSLAAAANWVVMPIDCPICVPSNELMDSIPEELRDQGCELVGSGADILRVVRSS